MSTAAIAALVLTACSGGGNNAGGEADPNAIISVYGNEPQRPLIPADTGEVFGGRIVSMLFQGLYSYDMEGGPVEELAESVESSDQQNYTVTIKSGQTFTDGEAVTAQSFVDSWNYAALSTNAMRNAYFFSTIDGFDEVSATEGEGENEQPAPKAQTMSGLSVVDDTTFTVALSAPDPEWPLRLGYTAYYPMPAKAFEDISTYGQSPIGNGPYKLASPDAWQRDRGVSLVKNDDYQGPREAKNGGIEFQFYTDPAPAYTQIQDDSLDVLDVMPANALRTYETDLAGRSQNKEYAGNDTLVIPGYLEQFQGEAGQLRRAAISQAINREEIAQVIFNGTRTSAENFAPSVLPGYTSDIPGNEVLQFDVEKAKQAWDQANQMQPWNDSQPLTIAYNTDGGHKEWADAVANQISSNLGIRVEGEPYPKFATMLDDRVNLSLDGLSRGGWTADYPSIYNFLAPLLATGASSNLEKYSNPEFDQLLEEGLSAPNQEEAVAKYNQAQEILFEDLPTVPLWNRSVQIGWSTKVSNVETDWVGQVRYFDITKTN
nr:ABC transporter substrate-binding protein [Acaricomes phytoseiuli]